METGCRRGNNRDHLPVDPEFFHVTGEVFSSRPLFGGDINHVEYLLCDRGEFVCKSNSGVPDDFFRAESEGLSALKGAGLRVPEVLAVSARGLLLEYIDPGKKDQESEESAGRALAQLHLQKQLSCGFEHDNYIGSLKQSNGSYDNWASFYIEKRLKAQLHLLQGRLSAGDKKIWEMFFQWIGTNLKPLFFSLLHGDIWSGNLFYGSEGPVFIDPAVYRGDFRVDLAFSEMFGGFSQHFYGAYNELNRFEPGNRSGEYETLKPVYQVYPLLVHANLFGGGYYSSALAIARRFVG